MKAAIYQIKNLINNKVYVGSSRKAKRRLIEHKHHLNKNVHANKYLQHAWNKYWSVSFKFEILEYCNEEKLIEREQYWINKLNCCDPKFGYNINATAGSNLGYRHTEEFKAKMSALHKNKIFSQETREKMKANHHLRNKEKWPHKKGRLCKCDECRLKNNEYRMLWKRKKRLERLSNV